MLCIKYKVIYIDCSKWAISCSFKALSLFSILVLASWYYKRHKWTVLKSRKLAYWAATRWVKQCLYMCLVYNLNNLIVYLAQAHILLIIWQYNCFFINTILFLTLKCQSYYFEVAVINKGIFATKSNFLYWTSFHRSGYLCKRALLLTIQAQYSNSFLNMFQQ